ncbi:pPIWI-associating nuclease domain-containing protein [Nitrincola iocasae]|uniref:pPIWI-associating nuclease domain-containing protein n=1 Tax=Nitrincola iocasae TaxID=2614693 RepID=UPI001CD9E28C
MTEFEDKLFVGALRNFCSYLNPLRFNNFAFAMRELLRHEFLGSLLAFCKVRKQGLALMQNSRPDNHLADSSLKIKVAFPAKAR